MDMTAINARIAQFENMVREGADPTNDMAWFSLGGAYAQASRPADAARAYTRCFELNPAMSKAYQLAGKALIEAGDRDKAVGVLAEGDVSASERGDRMPMAAMGEMLDSMGIKRPEVASKAATSASAPLPDGTFLCTKSGRPGTKMKKPPFRGPVGQWIFDNISHETFEEWIRQGTKVINELRLDLSRDEDSEKYETFMRDYLGLDEETYQKLRDHKPV
jgi:Fe-S cluster biosynthesis and repair protein YggX